MQTGSKLHLPFENACTGRGHFRLRHVSSLLQADGKRGVGERILGSQCSKCHRCGYGTVKLAGVAKSTHQPVVRFSVRRVGSNGGAKCLDGFGRRAGSEQFNAAVAHRFGN